MRAESDRKRTDLVSSNTSWVSINHEIANEPHGNAFILDELPIKTPCPNFFFHAHDIVFRAIHQKAYCRTAVETLFFASTGQAQVVAMEINASWNDEAREEKIHFLERQSLHHCVLSAFGKYCRSSAKKQNK